MSVVLHAVSWNDISLQELLRYAAPGSVALLSAPHAYQVALVGASGGLETRKGTVRLRDVFEARCFDERAELRWVNIADGRGTGVLLTEDTALLPDDAGERLPDIEATRPRPGSYLLWGRSAGSIDGWTTLSAERIGTIDIPAQIPAEQHARIVTREYIAQDPDHGNAYVAEERLLRFDLATPETAT
ncbi:CRISPR-associated protein Csx19 [Nonomuraea sp. NPDC049309]|uniref:type III-D CRISPR-associated protein Csx19 n=1 Tax=Nonomuraea sp. NPDC049309 TaxID=3364350 RepID=UPI00371F0404